MEDLNQQQVFGIQELLCPPNAEIEYDCLGVIRITWLISLYSIVAVHGLNGDAHSTWTSQGNVCWLSHQDLLPKYIPSARVLTWGYNANVMSVKGRSTSADRILQHAQTLIAQLVADREVHTFRSSSHFLVASVGLN